MRILKLAGLYLVSVMDYLPIVVCLFSILAGIWTLDIFYVKLYFTSVVVHITAQIIIRVVK